MKLKKIAALLVLAGAAAPVFATNGYFATGVGIKAKAMGGAGIAYAEDGFGIGANPATLTQAQAGGSIGGSVFAPDRGVVATANGTGAGLPAAKDGNAKDMFLIPEFAYVKHASSNMSYGIAVYGNGGMNVDYGRKMYDSADTTFANLEQLFIAPTVAWKLNDRHTLAASLNIVYQTFEAGGLDWFTQYTRTANLANPAGDSGIPGNPFGWDGASGTDPGNHGKDSSTGIGIKLGWTGQLTKDFSMGAFYQPRTRMSKFDKYKDLFAENGRFDIPASYGFGVAFSASPQTSILFDVVQIDYSKIKALSNKNNHIASNTRLGADDGKGFGWTDMTVYKLGVRHQMDDRTTVRVGWNYGKQPIPTTELDFNLLAPAVVENHLTLGVTRKLDANSEITVSYMHAFNKKLSGTATQGTGTWYIGALEMDQNEVGVQYSWKF